MPFTSDEIQTAVGLLVKSSIRRPHDTLGTRRVDVTFSDIQEATAGVFLLHAKAPFYILSLGALRLLELVSSEAEQLSALLDAVAATGNRVYPVNDISTLANAQSALFELEGAVGTRTSGFQDITKIPAFVRYKSNLDKFLLEAGSNVKLNGEVVQTPQQARKAIAGLVTNLKLTHKEVIRLARLLSNGMTDYGSVNLPSLVAKGVISRARELLASHVDELSGQSAEQRLEGLRQVVLNLLAQKAVVKKFGSFMTPTSTLALEGTGIVYGDATHPVVPAAAALGVAGPFNTRTGRNMVDVFLNSGPVAPKIGGVFVPVVGISVVSGSVALFTSLSAIFAASVVGDLIYISSGPNDKTRWVVTQVVSPFQVQAVGIAPAVVDASAGIRSFQAPSLTLRLANAFVAEVRGTVNEPYLIDVGPPDSHFLYIDLDGFQATITLSQGAAQTADDVAADITSQNVGQNFAAEGFFAVLRFTGLMNITQVGPTARFTMVTGQLDGLGIKVGDQIKVKSGLNVDLLLTVTALDGAAPVTFIDATAVITPDTNVTIEVGTSRRVRIYCPDQALALRLQSTITLIDDPITAPALGVLGIFPGIFGTSRPSKASEVVTDIKSQTALLTPSVAFQLSYAGLARTEPLFPTRCVFYKLRAQGTIISALGAPPYTITVSIPSGGAVTAGVEVGDSIVLREGSTPGAVYTVVTVVDNQVTADGGAAASLDTNILIEIGPNLGIVTYGEIVNIASGPNTGDHHVESQSLTIPFELELQQSWPQSKADSLPVFFTDASLGGDQVEFTSADTTTASYVKATEANPLLTPTQLGVEGFMTTPYFQLPAIPEGLLEGDLLELYDSSYDTPDETFEVLSIDKTLKVIELDPEIDAVPASWVFGDVVPPFARLRAGRVIDFTGFKTKLDTWLARTQQQSAFFVDLSRFINPLVSNSNPTQTQVNDARNKVLELAGYLTMAAAAVVSVDPAHSLEDILTNYEVLPVSSVDVLLQTFAERGANRAKDLLLEGQFTTFFNLTVDSASYAGDVLEKMRSVARADLPIRKASRLDAVQGRSLGSALSPDYEHDQSDNIDPGLTPDPPVGGESIG